MKRTIIENNPTTLFYLIRKSDGTYATAADFSAISVTVTNITTATTGSAMDIDLDAIKSSIVTTDPRYVPTNDAEGYNAEINISGDEFADGNCEYQVEVTFTPTEGEPFTRIAEFYCQNRYAV